jgi:hypothetical protein
MDNYKVQLSSNSYNIKIKPTEPKYKVQTIYTGVSLVAQKLEDLGDVEQNTATDKYVFVWDTNTQTAKWVNPDEVLNNAAMNEITQPGLGTYTEPFIDALDVELDDRIDIDAGSF